MNTEKKWIQADKEYVEIMCYKTTFRAAMPSELRGAPIPGRKGKSSLQEDGDGMEQMQLTACSPAVQHSTELTSACSPSWNTAQTVPVAPYLHLLSEGDCSVPADTPGLCSSFRKLGWTTAGRAQYGSDRQDVCSSWILKVKFCSKTSIS